MTATIATIRCKALPADTDVAGVRGLEGVNALSTWRVGIVSSDPSIDFEALVGASAMLHLDDQQEGALRTVDLVVIDAVYDGGALDRHNYTVTLSQRQWVRLPWDASIVGSFDPS